MKNHAIPLELPEEYLPEWDKIKKAKSESIHGEASFELLKEIGVCSVLVSAIIPKRKYSRNEAITCALIVKISKLLKAIVAMTSHLGGDRQIALFRELIELMAILDYLLDDTDGSRFDKYIHNSLIVEKQFIEKISRNRKTISGREKIEERMMRSVEKTARAAGINDLASIPSRKKIGWPNFETLVSRLGSDLYLSYRSGSTVIHSEWNDLLRNHLILSKDGILEPNYEDGLIRPQPLYASGLLAVNTLKKYLLIYNTEALVVFETRLQSLWNRLRKVMELHSAFLD